MTKIMFVDDEQMVLSGLRRSLRGAAPADWDLSFVLGGREAVERIGMERFDVVVTDARMPDVNGGAVLMALRDASPDTVRMVLSGQMDVTNVIRLLELAHQFLAKPCRPETIVEQIKALLERRIDLVPDHVRSLLGGIDGLPTVPRIYQQLQSVMRGAETSARDIAEIIQTDPSLTAKLLRTVNSPYFGLRREVVGVAAAVAHLGSDLVCSIVLQVEVAAMQSSLGADELSENEQQTERVLAVVRNHAPAELRPVASAAGVLLDIGEIVLAMAFPDAWAECVSRRAAAPSDRRQVELSAFGATHEEVGAGLLAMWGVPESIVLAVRHHHDPSAAPGNILVAMLHLADASARAMRLGVDAVLDGEAIDAAGLGDVARAVLADHPAA